MPRSTGKRRCACGTAGLLLIGVFGVAAHAADDSASFVLRAKAVYPVTREQPGPLTPGMVIVRDGRIVAVGTELEVPADLRLVDMPDAVICPGFVSAGSALAGQHAGAESISGAYRALDAYDAYGDYREVLARGTTTVHLSPGVHRLASGTGAVVKLAGAPGDRALLDEADLSLSLGALNPPALFDPPFYASSDVPIEPAVLQRPDSRMGQFLAIEEQLAASQRPDRAAAFDLHAASFVRAWRSEWPLRIEAHRAMDLSGAIEFVRRHNRAAYLVGLTEADLVREPLARAWLPLVLRLEGAHPAPGGDVGSHPDALVPSAGLVRAVNALADAGIPVALAGRAGDPIEDLRLVAGAALRGGMPPERALAAITRVPAEILGVGQRVGSLAPGRDADLLVLTGDPLDINTHVQRAYVNGRAAFEAPASGACVVRGGTVWIGNGQVIRDGAVLIQDGRIRAVGQRVPHPPFARLVDAGPGAFITPGFIDARGHLGMSGDRSGVGADFPLHLAFAVVEPEFARVARAGVTTVVTGPYAVAQNGARMTAVKTGGQGRAQLVARELAGLQFSIRGQDPISSIERLRQALKAGKDYDAKWKKYDEDLAKWKAGEVKKDQPAEPAEPVTQEKKPDPISGVWEYTLSGDPLPQEVQGEIHLRLEGDRVEGRLVDPMSGEEVAVSGTFDGKQLRLEVDQDTPIGKPVIEATLDREDHLTGKIILGEFSINLEATRTSKAPGEVRVLRTRKRRDDGRPTPPKIDENLEPYRALLAGRIPAVVEAQTAGEIDAAIKVFVEEHQLPLILLGAEDAADVIDRVLAQKDKLAVIPPAQTVRTRARRPYCQAADLSLRGLTIALQSDREDGARTLPAAALYAVQAGLGGDAALRSLTSDAARAYKLDDRLGTLEPGKDADVLIFTGHPFDADSRLERVFVTGQEVPHAD